MAASAAVGVAIAADVRAAVADAVVRADRVDSSKTLVAADLQVRGSEMQRAARTSAALFYFKGSRVDSAATSAKSFSRPAARLFVSSS